ncbi:SDR family NAD(P)-dependent oxidoreductase [Amycolatopsis nigrescens]|uniref:SDR family NAD(P)-dependent oxidoreductase n=1 Tax=Amycolatopsis nigrescens TaxID=381445 RepID=UPI00037C7EFA|nr:SDR family oxidoreductase [Amycolatopsis nigrescens]
MSKETPFAGKTVIVTGAGTGIGRTTAWLFAEQGADVLAVGRTESRLRETAAAHPAIRTFAADVAAETAPAAIVRAALESSGRIDVLVNNAGIVRKAPLGGIDRASTAEQLGTNLTGPLFLTQEALPWLAEARGAVVNISSNPPDRGLPDNSVYGSTKVALDFLTRTWAVELGGRGIRVVSVAPGITRTPIMQHAGYQEAELVELGAALERQIPLGKLAQPEEIAWWIVQVARPEASYLTGAVLRVDGGLTVA